MTRPKVETEVLNLVTEFFGGDRKKARLWLRTPNPLLGQIEPSTLIDMGWGERVLEFVRGQLAENAHETPRG